MQHEINTVREFHTTFGVPQREIKSTEAIPQNEYELRHMLVHEEVQEALQELHGPQYKLTAELADVLYVVAGTGAQLGIETDSMYNHVVSQMMLGALEKFKIAIEQKDHTAIQSSIIELEVIVKGIAYQKGLPVRQAFDEIHQANMRKVAPDGTLRYREDGKILKPDGWKPADIENIYKKYKQDPQ